jgi:hypothetical protein
MAEETLREALTTCIEALEPFAGLIRDYPSGDMVPMSVTVLNGDVFDASEAIKTARAALASTPAPVGTATSNTTKAAIALVFAIEQAGPLLDRIKIARSALDAAVAAERAKWEDEVAEISNRLKAVERIQGLVRADEMEACAKIAAREQYADWEPEHALAKRVCSRIVAAIRARGQGGEDV